MEKNLYLKNFLKKSSSNKDFFWYFSDFIVSDDKYKEMKKSSYCFLIFQMDGKESLFEELFKKSKDFFWYLSDFIVSDDKFMTIFNFPNGWKRIFIWRTFKKSSSNKDFFDISSTLL